MAFTHSHESRLLLENSVGIFKPRASADRVLTVQFNPAMLLVQLITPKKVLAEDERETTMRSTAKVGRTGIESSNPFPRIGLGSKSK